VAAALGWPISTVHTFCRTDGAPEYRWNVIKALRKCIKVTDKTDIMPPAQAPEGRPMTARPDVFAAPRPARRRAP